MNVLLESNVSHRYTKLRNRALNPKTLNPDTLKPLKHN